MQQVCFDVSAIETAVSKIAAEKPVKVKIVRVNADENTELCKLLNVSALPVLKLYKNDKVVWDNLGFVTEQEVRKQISK